jgi:hypothetical protein
MMLSFDISTVVENHDVWRRDGETWVGPAGWVRPFCHPSLTVDAVLDGSRLTLMVAERCENPDFMCLEADDRAVTVKAGPLGRAPVYVRYRDGRLTGSWRITDLMGGLPFGGVNGRELTRLLTRRHRFSSATVFDDILRVTERAQVSAGAQVMRVRYPEPVEHPSIRRALRQGVDPVTVVGDLIGQHLGGRSDIDAVELSGGADSALVAAEVVRSIGHPIQSLGLVMPGEAGAAQAARRAEIIDALTLKDTAIPATSHPPFGAGRRHGLHDPASSYYCELFDVLANEAAHHRARVIATGLGGDELMACAADARPTLTEVMLPAWLGAAAHAAVQDIDEDLAPSAHLSTPTLMALSSHAPGLLAAGVWPVAPLADPGLTRFCRQLPEELVAGKLLLRRRLTRWIAKSVAFQPSPEDFRPVMQIGMRRFGLRALEDYLKRGMLLADLGYIEPLKLQTAVNAAHRASTVDSRLADVLRVEHGLRRAWGEL